MKTTIEISDGLLRRAKQQAARSGTSVRALVEQGLVIVLRDAGKDAPYRLRDAGSGRGGLTPEAQAAGWHVIRQWGNERAPIDRG